jgi:hypothetical protein
MNQTKLNSLFEYRNGELYWKIRQGRSWPGRLAGTNHKGYRRISIDHKLYLVHRLIFLYHHGWTPAEIDHIDGNSSNSRIENLRAATPIQNNANRGLRINNTSGVKGVCWRKDTKQWFVQVSVNGKYVVRKYIKDLELAELVAIEARNKYHGEFARHI